MNFGLNLFFSKTVDDHREGEHSAYFWAETFEKAGDFCLSPLRLELEGEKIEVYTQKFVPLKDSSPLLDKIPRIIERGLVLIPATLIGALVKSVSLIDPNIRKRNQYLFRLTQKQKTSVHDLLFVHSPKNSSAEIKSNNPLLSLPFGVFETVMAYLEERDYVNLAVTCKEALVRISQYDFIRNIPKVLQEIFTVDEILAWPKLPAFIQQAPLTSSVELSKKIQDDIGIDINAIWHLTYQDSIPISEIKQKMTAPIQWGRDCHNRPFIAIRLRDRQDQIERVCCLYQDHSGWEIDTTDLSQDLKQQVLAFMNLTSSVADKALFKQSIVSNLT